MVFQHSQRCTYVHKGVWEKVWDWLEKTMTLSFNVEVKRGQPGFSCTKVNLFACWATFASLRLPSPFCCFSNSERPRVSIPPKCKSPTVTVWFLIVTNSSSTHDGVTEWRWIKLHWLHLALWKQEQDTTGVLSSVQRAVCTECTQTFTTQTTDPLNRKQTFLSEGKD